MNTSKQAFRQRIKQQRAGLSTTDRASAAVKMSQIARECEPVWRAQKILDYRAFGGEMDTAPLLRLLKPEQTYLPKIQNYELGDMQFFPAADGTQTNRYGIEEPLGVSQAQTADYFDLILVPLVAFDRSGNRIGMGAGFYDKALSCLASETSDKPFLLGIAYQFQEIAKIQADAWDVALDAILTDSEYIEAEPHIVN